MDADVIVVGAGNAGMSAAHAARERGARVLVLEKAPREWSGGNSAFTAGAMRVAHGGVEDVRDVRRGRSDELRATDLQPYTAEEFLADMERVTLGRGDARWRACWSATPPTRCAGCATRDPVPADVRAPGLRGADGRSRSGAGSRSASSTAGAG